ncbi:MAG: hypothetical protein ACOX50_00995 [Patescibacteria group bacterium]
MFVIQVIAIFILLVIFSEILTIILKRFNQSAKLMVLLVVPLVSFCLGFVLRLSGQPRIIDLGYFFY